MLNFNFLIQTIMKKIDQRTFNRLVFFGVPLSIATYQYNTANLSHQVKSGETLNKISHDYQVDRQIIFELNKDTFDNKNMDCIQVDRVLFIPMRLVLFSVLYNILLDRFKINNKK